MPSNKTHTAYYIYIDYHYFSFEYTYFLILGLGSFWAFRWWRYLYLNQSMRLSLWLRCPPDTPFRRSASHTTGRHWHIHDRLGGACECVLFFFFFFVFSAFDMNFILPFLFSLRLRLDSVRLDVWIKCTPPSEPNTRTNFGNWMSDDGV